MAGLCEGGNEPRGSLKASPTPKVAQQFCFNWLRENPGKTPTGNLSNQDLIPDPLVSRSDLVTGLLFDASEEEEESCFRVGQQCDVPV
ncbi:hypothetical protein ANN_12217 [Periplaneta americana]|uniref:Uncharacterized protein n=1 Tax=Periplaneta americana TaxID=6978 RepID=A0ABQ8THY8_PERAM|nr:hypothetical protein ANN_12217 [Periplaneta americana]